MKIHPQGSKIRDWLAPALLLLLISAITFLPLVSQLGYYVDDWQTTWAGHTQGAMRIFEMSTIDRPGMGLFHAATYLALGDRPIVWHLYAWLLRLIGTLGFLWLVRQLWPQQKRATLLMALLFLVYPGFLAQPIANSYSDHLMAYAMGIFSIAFSLRALQAGSRREKILFAALSVPTALYCYLVMEWMVGLEAVRGLLIWYLLRRDGSLEKLRAALLPTLRAWLPNLLAAGAFLIWRFAFFKDARAATDVSALGHAYLSNPLPMLGRLVLETVRSFIETVFLAWAVPLYNLTISTSSLDLLVSALLALAGVAVLVLYFRRVPQPEPAAGVRPALLGGRWELDAAALGALIALITLLPVIAANRTVQFQDTFDRYTLAAILGVAMLVIGGSAYLLSQRQQLWLVGVLLAVSILVHYNNAAYYRNFWNYQRQFWWQLTWRAPDIKKDTTLLALFPKGYRIAEAYDIWTPANLIYHPQKDALWLSGETVNDETALNILQGQTYTTTFRHVTFAVDVYNSLLASLPAGGSCLHVQDGQNPEFSSAEEPLVRLLAPASRPDLIDVNAAPAQPPTSIFGPEPAHTWCYYYQKAQLARQAKRWDEVARLGDEAARLGLAPQDVSEWMPFYQGYAQVKNQEEVNRIGGLLRTDGGFINVYCRDRLAKGAPQDRIELNALKNICPDQFP